ncbi:MAG: phosphoribosylanthranilate isomerase [Oscillospiraceae bacterium]|nr:phosphoribosylanthranilate isomerase [Oscillospiraceae bacterium]
MTKIKLCGLSRPCDIETANALHPDYIGFLFAEKSRRYVSPETAAALKRLLDPSIEAVGVFVNAPVEFVAGLLQSNIIDVAQLHGSENQDYVRSLRALTDKPIFQAFRVETKEDVLRAQRSKADNILLDSGSGGTGTPFDWSLLQGVYRPYFLAGGLFPENVVEAIDMLHPYGVDVSSGIETDGKKDKAKMAAFVHAVRNRTGKE